VFFLAAVPRFAKADANLQTIFQHLGQWLVWVKGFYELQKAISFHF
jgi:hypothetical protein